MKEDSVLSIIKTGDSIVEVCKGCLKYGEELKVTDVDRIIRHCNDVDVVFIGKEPGE